VENEKGEEEKSKKKEKEGQENNPKKY